MSCGCLRQFGFTLIEALVYIAILLTVSAMSVVFLFSLSDIVAEYRVETDLYRSSSNSMEQIILSLRQADTFELTSVEDNENGVLAVSDGATTTVFTRNGTELQLRIDGEDFGNMLRDTVSVTNFTVYKYDTAIGEFVRVRLSLTATVGGVTKDMTVYGGSVIRGAL